ncbi:MAG: LamG domain-containing protein [Bryobacteraceae bacterium]|nr:LamG domain-containing protein [Bryobacteraceae bacterium]
MHLADPTFMTSYRLMLAAALLLVRANAQSLTDGIVSYYPFNGNLADPVGGTQGVIAAGSPTPATGKLGGAYFFNGTEDESSPRVYGNLVPSVNTWSGGTISVWVQATAYAIVNRETIWQIPSSAGFSHLWGSISPLTRQFEFRVGTGTGEIVLTSHVLNNNEWYHITATWSRTLNTAQVYVNGVLHDEKTAIFTQYLGGTILLGAGFNGYGMRGTIDEVGIWNRPLPPAEISALYNSGNGTTYPFSATQSGRTILVTFTGGNTAPDGSNCFLGHWGTRVVYRDDELLAPSRGMTNLILNARNVQPNVVAKAFTFFSNGGNSCLPPPSGAFHAEASTWITDAAGANIQPNDRLIIAGHSFGGNRARYFAEEIDTILFGMYQQHLIAGIVLVDPIDWSSCPIPGPQCLQRFESPRDIRAGVVTPSQVMVFRQGDITEGYTGYTVTVGGQPVPSLNISLKHTHIDDGEPVQRHIVNLLNSSTPVGQPGVLLRLSLVEVAKESLTSYRLRLRVWNDKQLIMDNVAVTKATLGLSPCTAAHSDTPVLPGFFKEISLRCSGIPFTTVRLSIEGTYNNFGFGGGARVTLP